MKKVKFGTIFTCSEGAIKNFYITVYYGVFKSYFRDSYEARDSMQFAVTGLRVLVYELYLIANEL